MGKSTTDPIAAALDAEPPSQIGPRGKIETLFGDRPQVLEAIVRARSDRKLSCAHIAKKLTQTTGQTISEGAVRNWLTKQGIE